MGAPKQCGFPQTVVLKTGASASTPMLKPWLFVYNPMVFVPRNGIPPKGIECAAPEEKADRKARCRRFSQNVENGKGIHRGPSELISQSWQIPR